MIYIDNKKLIPLFAIFAALLIGISVWQNSHSIRIFYSLQESYEIYAIIAALISIAMTLLFIVMLWRIFFAVQDKLLKLLGLAVIASTVIPQLFWLIGLLRYGLSH